MYTHLTEQIATQHQTEMRTEAARQTRHRQARQARRMRQTGQTSHRHPVRRRAGYALISIGLRLAYAAGDD